ncbi:hypothetical protein [Legionella jordanis]|nr:hypothetical protein [Legionella jordanis]
MKYPSTKSHKASKATISPKELKQVSGGRRDKGREDIINKIKPATAT